jgi:phosphopantothenoylcysteine synthetase/decarboxylase
LDGKRILVLGGSPREIIDGVRHYANKGRDQAHGVRVVHALTSLGAKVTFITTKSTSPAPAFDGQIDTVESRKITSTKDLIAACVKQNPKHHDAVLQLANIPSIAPLKQSDQKLKVKSPAGGGVSLEITGNIDILAQLQGLFPAATIAGYNNQQHWVSMGHEGLAQRIRAVADQYQERGHTRMEMPLVRSVAATRELKGRKAIVTSGPTVEPINHTGDVITNFSSGRQGHAVAEALADMGAVVVLVSGPTALMGPSAENIRTINIRSAREMHDVVLQELPADIFVGVAAVADFSMQSLLTVPLTEDETYTLHMRQNPDILQAVGTHLSQRPSVVVGFAAETHDVLNYARAKLERKGADFICANQVGDVMANRSSNLNAITFVTHFGHEELQEIPKLQVGKAIGSKIAQLLKQKACGP